MDRTLVLVQQMVREHGSWSVQNAGGHTDHDQWFAFDGARAIVVHTEASRSERQVYSGQTESGFALEDIGSVTVEDGILMLACRGQSACVTVRSVSHQYDSVRNTAHATGVKIPLAPTASGRETALQDAFYNIIRLRRQALVEAGR